MPSHRRAWAHPNRRRAWTQSFKASSRTAICNGPYRSSSASSVRLVRCCLTPGVACSHANRFGCAAVADFDTFSSLGKHSARDLLLEVRDTLGDDLKEKIPDAKLDKLIAALYPKEPAAKPKAPAKPSTASTAVTEPPVIAETPSMPAVPLAPACERYNWTQSNAEVLIVLDGLPAGTRAKDIALSSKYADSIGLYVSGERVVDAKLFALVDQNESEFNVADSKGNQNPGRTLTVTLTKASTVAAPWPRLLKEED